MRRPLLFLTLPVALLLGVLPLKLPPLSDCLDGPGFCGSCHVMREQVDSYLHSAHREVATCNNCHIPHDLIRGAFYKAYTGTKDVAYVTAGLIPQVIEITPLGRKVIQENCLRCHDELLREVGDTQRNGGRYCVDCHRSTPHLR